jgi:hypothetical protein
MFRGYDVGLPLPKELLCVIFLMLNPYRDWFNIVTVCKQWNTVIKYCWTTLRTVNFNQFIGFCDTQAQKRRLLKLVCVKCIQLRSFSFEDCCPSRTLGLQPLVFGDEQLGWLPSSLKSLTLQRCEVTSAGLSKFLAKLTDLEDLSLSPSKAISNDLDANGVRLLPNSIVSLSLYRYNLDNICVGDKLTRINNLTVMFGIKLRPPLPPNLQKFTMECPEGAYWKNSNYFPSTLESLNIQEANLKDCDLVDLEWPPNLKNFYVKLHQNAEVTTEGLLRIPSKLEKVLISIPRGYRPFIDDEIIKKHIKGECIIIRP